MSFLFFLLFLPPSLVPFLLAFFFFLIVAHPPLPLSLFIRPFLRLLRPLPRPLLFMGHISPSVPLFSLQSSFFPSCPPFFRHPHATLFLLSYLPSTPTLAQMIKKKRKKKMGPITPFVYPSFHPIMVPPPLFLLIAPRPFPLL